MRNPWPRLAFFLGLLVLTLPARAVTLTSIAVVPSSATLAAGASVALTAVGTFSDASTRTLNGLWTSKAPLNELRDGQAGAFSGGKLYIFGGASSPGLPTGSVSVEAYDTATDSWTYRASTCPVRRGYAFAAENAGKIYIAGGCVNADCNSPTAAVWEYDVAADSWTAKLALPVATFESAMETIGGKLYAAGGLMLGYVSTTTLRVYDPVANTWTTKAPMPVSRGYGASGVINGKLYVAGGHNTAGLTGAELQIYDPVADAWSLGAPMPSARSVTSGGVVNGRLYVIAGDHDIGATNSTDAARVQVYDASLNSWTEGPALQVSRYSPTVGAYQGKLYVAAAAFGNAASAAFETMTPDEVAWSSDAPTIATVTTGGLATALSGGTAHVSASSGAVIGIATISVPAAPSAPSSFAGAAQSSASILWSWTDNSSIETGFRVMSGAANLSGDLAANTTAWLQIGLTANATSGTLFARAFNSTGTADSGAAQVYALTDSPNSITATFFGSSVAFTWPTMTNPPGTRWAVDRGTDGVSYAQLYFSSAAAAYTDATGMSLGTSYYYRIRSANGDGVFSAHANASAIVFTGGGAPSSPSGFTGVAQSTSSILWSWTDNSSNETGFRVMSGATNVSGNLTANTTIWLQTGLSVNTSSGSLFAQAFNSTGTTNSGSVTRFSLTAVPTGLASSSVFQTSATISWAGTATTYQLERSTGAVFATASTSAAASYGDTGLSAASTYYYRVLGYNGDGIATAYASSITVVTSPAPVVSSPTAPSGFAGAAQTTTSILWSWTDNSSNETGFRIMAGATNVSGNLAANTTIWLQAGLAVNTSSGSLFVQAFNSTGTTNSGSLTRYSLAAVPTGLASSNVFQTSATISWAGSATTYQLERSTLAVFSTVSSSATPSYGDTGLSAASTYYYRVLGYNGDGIATAYASSITVVTSPAPAASSPTAPSGFAGAAQTTTSILWSWTDNSANETGFRVMAGATNVSGNLAADTTIWLQTGLSVNTSSGSLFVQAFSSTGTANSSSLTRYSLAAAPTGLASSNVALTSATISWAGSATTYQLERSTGGGFATVSSSAASSYADAALAAASTYYYRVLGYNGDAIATAYASSIAVVTLPLPAVPGAPGTPIGTALGTSSVTWTWALASGATSHFLFRASDNASLGSSPSGPFVQSALAPNTAYGLRVAGVNAGGTGPLSPSATVYTWAAVPSAPAAASSSATVMNLSWGLNGNPVSTVAEVLRSTNAVVYSTFTVAAAAAATDPDLLGCTTYYYKVRNVNGSGLPTAYASFQGVTANTVPSPPSAFAAAANAGGSVALSWSPSPTEGITGYRLYWDAGTGTVSYGAPLAGLGPTATAFTTGVLTSSASYTFALRAVHRCGVEETAGALAMSGAAVAPPALRAVVKEPDSGKRIHGNRVTILGELIYGTPADAQQVLFQYKLAAATSWLDVPAANVNHSNPDLDFPYFVHWNVNILVPGDYDLRAVAFDRGGVPDAAPPAVRVSVVASAANADIDENDVAGAVKKDQTIANGVTSVIDTAGEGSADPAVRVTIPAGAVNASTATVSVTANPAITTAAPSGQTLVGSAIKIDLSNGQSALNGTAAITLTYPDTVLFPSLLQIFYLNELTGQWSRDFASTVDTASHTVTGNTPHFSTFALMLGTAFAANLDNVRVYPVPFKPNGSNADEGRPFSQGDPNSGIIFANLAMGSEIKIYTLTGRLVSSLDNAPVTGTLRWDAKNQDGRDVASGAYFAVIKAGGQKTVTKKLVIIR